MNILISKSHLGHTELVQDGGSQVWLRGVKNTIKFRIIFTIVPPSITFVLFIHLLRSLQSFIFVLEKLRVYVYTYII